jgi:hypothetical protein
VPYATGPDFLTGMGRAYADLSEIDWSTERVTAVVRALACLDLQAAGQLCRFLTYLPSYLNDFI